MSNSKVSLREMFKEYRNRYSETVWMDLSSKIQKNTCQLIENLDSERIGIYLKSTKSREVNTDFIVQKLFATQRKLFIPRLTDQPGVMELTTYEADSKLVLNNWGIPEVMDADAVELIPQIMIVPMLGGDMNGYRMGYGKGYYDRFFEGKESIKIGLCPSSCLINRIPYDSYDVKMNYIITEAEILRTNA